MANDYVVFLVYKQPEMFTQCDFHLLRYLSIMEQQVRTRHFTYLIYTDHPARFDRWKNTELSLELIPMSLEQIRSWYGPQQYLYRAKIVAIKDALQRTRGNVLYCDADTYPRREFSELFRRLEEGDFFMHENEGCIDKAVNPHFFSYHDWFTAHPAVKVDSGTYTIPLTTQVWNSGVVGIGRTQAHILDNVLEFCDALYKAWPHFAVEQFALGYKFQYSPQGCKAAKDYVYHYWSIKRYALLLDRLFELYGSGDRHRLMRASQRVLAEDLAPIKEKWDQCRWDASRPFRFVWKRYPRLRDLVWRFQRRQWPIEEQFWRLTPID